MKVIRRKLYHRLTPENMGYDHHAFIVFASRPVLFNSKTLSDEEAKIKGHRVESFPVKWDYFLSVDLWFVILDFQWFKDIKI